MLDRLHSAGLGRMLLDRILLDFILSDTERETEERGTKWREGIKMKHILSFSSFSGTVLFIIQTIIFKLASTNFIFMSL